MVLQDTWLFEGSIKDNIKYAKTEAADEEVREAAKAVGLHHYVKDPARRLVTLYLMKM